jgi:hypothetical protein
VIIKQGDNNDGDLNFFMSLVPYMKLPPTERLFLRLQFQNMVANESSALQNNLLHSSAKSSNTIQDNRPAELYYMLSIDVTP